jgi:2TM domain
VTTTQETPPEDQLRQAAVTRLRKKRDFHGHLIAYVTVNLLLNGIWLITGPDRFYWPIIPLLGWGIGLVFHAWDTYSSTVPSEERIQKEMRRIAKQQ